MASPPPHTGGGHSLLSSNANVNNNTTVKKSGYLRKQKHGHKRYFVLREPSAGCPARLEYYESEKKWRNKSAPKRVIPLDCCLNINKRADAKHKHLIALYTKDEYFAVAADNELEQDTWYRELAELMSEGRACDGSSASDSASSLVGFDEANYGMITPVSAAYREVWQVNLKSKGLGQSRNLTGVFRLCLSSRTISFVKLNSEVASVILQLMNIRRCGHSDSFFFIEVGRSAATGPGELWMQADDSVVAQNIHETILEAMKAMKELSEFRPRSKSQSSSTNPISVPTRRHLNNLPPSQTGLLRRSRTDSTASSATSPVGAKFSSCRSRAASEGDGTMARPVSSSASGSPLSPGLNRTPLGRSNTVTGRPGRTAFEAASSSSSLQHSRSMSMPVSPLPGATPGGAIPSGRASCGEIREVGGGALPPHHLHHHHHHHHPHYRHATAGCSASPSPSDAGFLSCDEYGSSPASSSSCSATDLARATPRCDTPESLGADTPPGRDPAAGLHGYMVMEGRGPHCGGGGGCGGGGYRPLSELERAYRRRTYSLTTPRQQRAPPAQLSSASLDEYTLMRASYAGQSDRRSHAGVPKAPEDFGSAGHLGDSGYMPMMPGVAPPRTPWGGVGRDEAYVPMSAMCVSAPKQIINPRSSSSSNPSPAATPKVDSSPGSSLSLEDAGYMRMWCSGGHRAWAESAGNGEYLNMSPVDPPPAPPPPFTPPDYRPRPLKAAAPPRCCCPGAELDQYVVMTLRRESIQEESGGYCPASSPGGVSSPSTPTPPSSSSSSCYSSSSSSSADPSPLRSSAQEAESEAGPPGPRGGRLGRPTRLALESLRTLPRMSEHPPAPLSEQQPLAPPEPRSPGEYVNIDFGAIGAGPQPSPPGKSPLPPFGSAPQPYGGGAGGEGQTGRRGGDGAEEVRPTFTATFAAALPKDDYTEMTFSPVGPPPLLGPASAALPAGPALCAQRLSLGGGGDGGVVDPEEASFLFPGGGPASGLSPSDPDRGAKVIRADPAGRRRHSSETFSSTTTVTPVCPSFARDAKRHSSASVENVWRPVRAGGGGEDESFGVAGGDGVGPMCRETSAGFQNGLNYIALNLMEGGLAGCGGLGGGAGGGGGGGEGLLRFKASPAACGCKGGVGGFGAGGFGAGLGFKEAVTAVKD